jgi:6-phosphogluconolactonase (cycloisomerase 2 family)
MNTARRSLIALAAAAAAALSLASIPAHASRIDGRGHVFTTTNDPAGNAVLVFERQTDGVLTLVQTAPTGGNGTGAGLGSQGALALSTDRHYLFTVNAASDTVSSFLLTRQGIQLVSTVSSGGHGPISITERSGVVYVVHSGAGATVVGFRSEDGVLSPIAGASYTLSDDTIDVGPGQVSFDALGRTVMITEKNTNLLDTWRAMPDGTLSGMQTTASAGATPFGFAFDSADHVVVSEAKGGADGSGASSYRFPGNAPQTPEVVTASLGTGQLAACWAAVTPDGRWAFTANAGSGSISTFAIDGKGALFLRHAAAETVAGSHPTDMAISSTSKRLFVLNTGTGNIASFAIGGQGLLWALSTVGVPLSAVGLVTE